MLGPLFLRVALLDLLFVVGWLPWTILNLFSETGGVGVDFTRAQLLLRYWLVIRSLFLLLNGQ